MTGELRLLALDADDLAVVSAHVQDAVLKVREISWLKGERRLVLAMNRFAWESAAKGLFGRKEYERRRSVLHFERVAEVRATGLEGAAREQVLAVLAISFTPGDAPSGDVDVVFSGGATLRLSVECIEAQLTDLGPAWSTTNAPEHDASPA